MFTKKVSHLLAILLIFFCGCDLRTEDDFWNEAAKLENQGKHKEAIQVLNEAIEKYPNFLTAYSNRGVDHYTLGNYEEAIQDLRKALEIDSLNMMALFNLGLTYKELGNYSTALEFYNKAIASKGGGPVYLEMVPNDFINAAEFDVPLHYLFYERGLAYYELDSIKKARNDFHNSAQQNYMVAESHYMMGACYIKAGMTEEACKEFVKANYLGDTDANDMIREYCLNK